MPIPLRVCWAWALTNHKLFLLIYGNLKILKATNIIEKKKTIEVDVDVLNINEDNDLYNKYYEANVLEYDSKLVVAKYKLILGKNENKTHKIISFIRVS